MQGKKEIQPKMLYQVHLDDLVAKDNFYRKLNSVLDLRFLYQATANYYGEEGQESIDPVVFFKLILIGYLENLGSDRRIINTVTMRLDMLYFIETSSPYSARTFPSTGASLCTGGTSS